MNIENFASGIISAAAYSRNRDVACIDASNIFADDEGFLNTRQGYRRLPSGTDQIVSIFAHFGYVLGVTRAGELKWETQSRLNTTQDGNLFRSFIPAREGFNVAEPTNFIADNNDVFVSNPNIQLKITLSNDDDPEATPFYIPALTAASVTISDDTSAETVFVRLQPIKTASQPEGVAFDAYPIEAVGISRRLADRIANDAILDINLAEGLSDDTDADFVDVFQTQSIAVNENADYFFVGRIRYQAGVQRISLTTDAAIETARLLVEPIATPDWRIAERSNDRLYLNQENSARIYMTYFDGSMKYLRSVTDYLDVQTGGRAITGMKILQQNMLAVYTEARIFLLNIDPLPENHSVIEVISSRDDRDSPIGCIAPDSIVDINGYHYFLAGNRQVYRYGGQRISWMSAPINPHLEKVRYSQQLTQSVGFARGLKYCLSYPSEPTSTRNDGMLIYDTQRGNWWKDNIPNLSDITKGETSGFNQTEYGLIDSWPAILNEGVDDNGEPIEWYWKGNKILIPLNTLIHSVFVGALPEDVEGDEPTTITVTLKTEEGEQSRELEVPAGLDYWNQYAGFNLRGRSVQVTLSGTGVAKIDRLVFNPQS